MDDLMLPPLPDPIRLYLNHKGTEVWGFVEVQMREYAKAAVEADRSRLERYGTLMTPDGTRDLWIEPPR